MLMSTEKTTFFPVFCPCLSLKILWIIEIYEVTTIRIEKKIDHVQINEKCFFKGKQNRIDSVKRTRFSPNIKDTSFIFVFDVALSFQTLLRKKFFERQLLLLFIYYFLAFVSFVEDKNFFENFNFNILHIK